ncbi:MAG: flagellar biosynthesis protein FlhB [Alphaproteobacteria bacterium]
MADDKDDSQKTEEPTPKRLDDARKKGQVAQSREVSSWLMLLTVAIIVVALAPGIMSDLGHVLLPFIERPHTLSVGSDGIIEGPGLALSSVLMPLAVPFALLVVAALATGFLQHGFLISAESLKPDFSKISPLKGLERMFSSRSLAEFAKGILKLVVVSGVGIVAIWPEIDTIERLVAMGTAGVLDELHRLVMRLLIGVCAILAAIAALDYFYQRMQHLKQLRMSREEVREEYKQTEGDPHVKARIRQLRQERARRRMMAAVPSADVVITNPTHFAVALKYEQATMSAPRVVAKGVDLIAHRIREVAKANEVPIVENPPLARALYATVELDAEIPGEHYKAIAEIIGYVWRLKGKMKPHAAPN